MTLPSFAPGDDPGPSFTELLRRTGFEPPRPERNEPGGDGDWPGVGVTHGTTIVAIRYADGVVMAGDRRATEGYSISQRAIEKVFPADRHSAVSIAGAAGPAMDMVKLFQTELEHYEKVEGLALSLEGKANKLGGMIRSNLPMAMQGLAVVPIFAGYDVRRRTGRIFKYDVTGGRYEEGDFHATGSGGRDARTTIKLGYREGLTRADAIELAVEGLYEAADEDSATGGPDVVRGIYPTVATITAEGFQRVADDEVAERFGTLIDRKRAEGQRAGDRTSSVGPDEEVGR
jgi:proteasome beta subunit